MHSVTHRFTPYIISILVIHSSSAHAFFSWSQIRFKLDIYLRLPFEYNSKIAICLAAVDDEIFLSVQICFRA